MKKRSFEEMNSECGNSAKEAPEEKRGAAGNEEPIQKSKKVRRDFDSCADFDSILEEMKLNQGSQFSRSYNQLLRLFEIARSCSSLTHEGHVDGLTQAVQIILNNRGSKLDEYDFILLNFAAIEDSYTRVYGPFFDHSSYQTETVQRMFEILLAYFDSIYEALTRSWDAEDNPEPYFPATTSRNSSELVVKMEHVITTGNWSGQGADEECPICMEPRNHKSNMAILDGCNHTFCNACAEGLFYNTKDFRCPVCRCEVKKWTNTNLMRLRRQYHHTWLNIREKSNSE